MRLKKIFHVGVLVVLSVVLFAACQKTDQVTSPSFESKSDEQGEVFVTVTPISLGESWDFEIDLTTHTVELSADLMAVTTLVDAYGKTYLPISWEGDPVGGHHRVGILKFQAVETDSFSIKIVDISGGEERVFEWEF